MPYADVVEITIRTLEQLSRLRDSRYPNAKFIAKIIQPFSTPLQLNEKKNFVRAFSSMMAHMIKYFSRGLTNLSKNE